MTSSPATRRSPLEGSLVRLRARKEADGAVLNPMFSDTAVLQNLQMAFPQPLQGWREFHEHAAADESMTVFAIETLDGEPVGGCGLHGVFHRASNANAGIWLGKPFWGKGYGTDAMRTLCRFGFREMNLHRIYLHVYATNPAAERCYEKVGFVREGTLREDTFVGGRYEDAYVMGLLASEFEDGGAG